MFKKWRNRGSSAKGMINTAAASALGRMLNKFCQKEDIPLLNIVRRAEQVKILQDEGAKNIINTSDANWLDQYKEAIKTHGFNMLFDAIGGGEISDKLISNLPSLGVAFIYGKLSSDNFVVSKPLIFSGGV
jgi:NADPH2:quinone reductase